MEYISLLLSVFSVIFSLITFLISNKRDSYTIIDDNYRDLLDLAIKHPEFRNPEMVKNYTDYKKKDPEFYWGYNSYAFEIWNFLETLCDLNNTKRDRQFMMKTWRPVILEENKLHFNWFTRNTRLFKNEFVYFVYHELNGFELRKGEKAELDKIIPAYIAAFPEDERKSERQLRKLFDSKEYEVIVASFQDREKEEPEDVAYAFVKIDYSKQLLFLDYLNVFPEYQSRGLGGVMLESLFDRKFHKGREIEAILLEIEKVEGKSRLSEEVRRRQFYMNHGARDLHIWDYGIPTADGGKLPLDLIIVPHYSSTFVPAKKLRSFVNETEKFIHSDFVHTDKVVDTYIHQFRDVHHNRGR